MTTALQEAWFKSAVGRRIDPDNAYGLQCVDVADDYVAAIFPGVPWQTSIGGVPGAKDFTGRNNKYVKWVPNIDGDLTSIPQRGDIIIWGGSASNPWGHVAVVLSATAHTVTVIQQDGFLQIPAHVATLPYYGPGTGKATGWMRPLVASVAVGANQRVTGPQGAQEFSQPKAVEALKKRYFGPDLVLTLKGYAVGERINGQNLWYVGTSGGYFHCSAFTSVTTKGLANLTPKPASYRKTGAAVAKRRETPTLKGTELGELKPNLDYDIAFWAKGDPWEGSDVWFQVRNSTGWVHSRLFTSQSIVGLTEKKVTVIPEITETQRFAGATGVTVRDLPNKNATALRNYKPGDILNFRGYVIAEDPYGTNNPYWLVGASGDYVWMGSVTPNRVGTLPKLPYIEPGTPSPADPAKPAPAPAVGTYTFPKRFATVTRVRPAHITNLQRGNFPENPLYCIIHQMDDPSKNPTQEGTASWFERELPNPASTHFSAAGDEFWAHVDIVDRAFSAGPVGNNYISIEVQPNPSAATIETVKKFLREWKSTKGYELQLIRHMEIPQTNTSCGTHIPLEAFSISGEPGGDIGAVITDAQIEEATNLWQRLVEIWKTGQK